MTPELSPSSNIVARGLILLGYAAALVTPGWVFFAQRGGTEFLAGSDLTGVLRLVFPLLGLYAFTFVTMQILVGSNKRWLEKVWPGIVKFHRYQGTFAFLFANLHPLFILLGFGIAKFIAYRFVASPLVPWVFFADAAWIILWATVGTAILVWMGRNISWWYILHRLNYAVFFLVWIHSWFIGSDVQSTGLRYLWLTYLALVTVSIVARYWKTWTGQQVVT